LCSIEAKRLVAVLTAVSLMAGLCGMAEPNADQKIKTGTKFDQHTCSGR